MMTDQYPAVVYLLAAHGRAQATEPVRVAFEREILAEHEGTWSTGEPEYGYHHEKAIVGPTGRTRYVEVRDDEPIPPYMCTSCSAGGFPCGVWIGLAKAWGWEEQK